MKLAIMFVNEPLIEIRNIPDSTTDVDDYVENYLGYDSRYVSWNVYDEDLEIKLM